VTPTRLSHLQLLWALAVTIVTVLLSGLIASAAGAHAKPRPAVRVVSVQPSGPAERLVVVATSGGRFSAVEVCDLKQTICAHATRNSPHRWRARLDAPEPSAPYEIGVVARVGRGYVVAGADH
jgi:hypothetical protein